MPNRPLLSPAAKSTGVIIGLALWLAAVVAGIAAMVNYESEPGRQRSQSARWPAEAPIFLDKSRPNLILFAHPRCPCTKATLAQLQQIVAHCGEQLKVQVFFYQPSGEEPRWAETALWQVAADIPGVSVQDDLDGAIAELFGAETSGQTFLYDGHGELLYSGGITGARGHEGDNLGQSRVLAAVLGESAAPSNASVFGCSLLETGPEAAAVQ